MEITVIKAIDECTVEVALSQCGHAQNVMVQHDGFGYVQNRTATMEHPIFEQVDVTIPAHAMAALQDAVEAYVLGSAAA